MKYEKGRVANSSRPGWVCRKEVLAMASINIHENKRKMAKMDGLLEWMLILTQLGSASRTFFSVFGQDATTAGR